MNAVRVRFPSQSLSTLCFLTHANEHDLVSHRGHVYRLSTSSHTSQTPRRDVIRVFVRPPVRPSTWCVLTTDSDWHHRRRRAHRSASQRTDRRIQGSDHDDDDDDDDEDDDDEDGSDLVGCKPPND